MPTTHRVNLWSSPRNVSTALMYSFAQREDTVVVDEPLYAHYLLRQPTEAEHPGREEIIAHQDGAGARVVSDLANRDFGKPVAVFKQMTHHLVDLDLDPLKDMLNVLLIRDPRAIIASYAKVVDAVTEYDVGIPQQEELLAFLREHDALTAIVDSKRLLQDPRGVLTELCARLGIDFDEKMLRWLAGPRPEDGVWAKHWYANVHRSTGFEPYRQRDITLPPRLDQLATRCQATYQLLLEDAATIQ